jgi:hypothetical protein
MCSCRSSSPSSVRRVRSLGADVDVGAAALDFFFVSLVSSLVAWVAGSLARHVRGPGAGVDVGATASDFVFVSLVSTLVIWVVGSSAS